MNLRVFEDGEAVAAALADEIIRRIEQRHRIVIGLSGGRTPRRVYELLGSPPRRPRISRRQIIWVQVDERCVPPYDEASNARLILETLFQHGIPEEHRFVRFRTDSPPAVAVRRFEDEYLDVVGDQPLDLATLGIGEDGHTASLFPGSPALDVVGRIATDSKTPGGDGHRLTLTLPHLKASGSLLILATGEDKRDVLQSVREGADLPITRVVKGSDAWWFVDRAAADPNRGLVRGKTG